MVPGIKITNETFIARARLIHGDKFGYEQVSCSKNCQSKVKIRCPKHGIFRQSIASHLRGCGCAKCQFEHQRTCGRRKKLNQEQFIQRCRAIWGATYNHDDTVFTDMDSSIDVVCPRHGVFSVKASGHIYRDAGCPGCRWERVKAQFTGTQAQFVAKARQVHGDQYEYDCTNYTGSLIKVSIGCKIHGIFMQRPSDHLDGAGCKKCGILAQSTECMLTQDEFVSRVKDVYGDRYDLSEAKYKGTYIKVRIRCVKHDKWFNTSAARLMVPPKYKAKTRIGCCPECIGAHISKSLRLDFDEFIRQLQAKHGDRYSMDRKDYRGGSRHTTMRCKIHGTIKAVPMDLLRRNGGCVICNAAKAALVKSMALNESRRKGDLTALIKRANKTRVGVPATFFSLQQALSGINIKENSR